MLGKINNLSFFLSFSFNYLICIIPPGSFISTYPRNYLEDFLLEVLILEDVGETGVLADRLAKLRNNLLPVTNMAIFVRNCK